jgi:hypothetical protein
MNLCDSEWELKRLIIAVEDRQTLKMPLKNPYQQLQQDDVFSYAKCVNYESEEH